MLRCSPVLRLAVIVVLCLSVRSFAKQQLLCSSNSMSIWWEYEGPLYYFSISTDPCTNRMNRINANYTLITKFSIARAGYTVIVYYRNQMWMELVQPPITCTDLNICNIVKGEMLSESLSLPINPYNAAEGEYRFYGFLNIIDDLNREISISINATIRVRSSDTDSELFQHVKAPTSNRKTVKLQEKNKALLTVTCSQQFSSAACVIIKRHKVFMMLWWCSPALGLAVVLCLSVRSFAEQKLLYSSNSLSIWWEYEVFNMVQIAWQLNVMYKNETWLAISQPMGPCEDFRICGLIKGESFHMTIPIILRPYFTPDGEYQAICSINIIDDFDRELTVRRASGAGGGVDREGYSHNLCAVNFITLAALSSVLWQRTCNFTNIHYLQPKP
ncbi:hypothetical protein Baya_9282 [Bagarius yarrelli]|uniref:Uncharacterized protein n=1 Tax=Bagarius yarrelli TaxID=175774 RepID=A0A556U767_BAGYA|nr:hypothetical protein Baya_9282 [Bagarius yarrelli]